MRYIVIVAIILMACSSPKKEEVIVIEKKDNLSESITAFIKKNAHDPGSYEPIETVPYDTVKINNVPCSLEFMHSCRIKNQFGALVKQEYYVQTDLELNVINMVSERNKRNRTPCERIEYLKSHPEDKL